MRCATTTRATAALEAFWGFYVRIVALHLGAPPEEIEPLRKDSRLSERRTGAMYLAHLVLTRTRYQGDPDGRRTFRNRVVHDGLFPTRDQAVDYATYVYDTILDGREQLRRLAEEAAQRLIAIEVGRGHQALRDRGVQSAISTTGVITILSPMDPRRPFADGFREWSEWNVWDVNAHHASESQAVAAAKTNSNAD